MSAMLRIIFLLLATYFAVEAAPLPPAHVPALTEQIQARQQQTKTWFASFTQTLSMPGMREPVVSSGTLAFQAPDNLRLDFAKPKGEFVLVVGDQLFLQKAGKPVTFKSLSDDQEGKLYESLLGFLRGEPPEDETLYDSQVLLEHGKYVFKLTRNQDAPDQLPRQITNTIDEKSLDVEHVFVELPNGGSLSYHFDGIKRNQPIGTAQFLLPYIR